MPLRKSINPYDLSGNNETQAVIHQTTVMGKTVAGFKPAQQPAEYPDYQKHAPTDPGWKSILSGRRTSGRTENEFRILHRPARYWEVRRWTSGFIPPYRSRIRWLVSSNSELSQKRLRFYLPENDLGKALTRLTPLFAQLLSKRMEPTRSIWLSGLLKRYETPSKRTCPRCPASRLLPVEIIRKSAAERLRNPFPWKQKR